MAPITSYSHTPFGTGAPAQKSSDGSDPIATAIGISALPPRCHAVTWWPICCARHITIRKGVRPGDLPAINTDIKDAVFGTLGDAAAVSEEIATAVEPVPMGRRQLVEIDVRPLEDILLHWPGGDDLGRDAAGQD